MTVKGEKIYGIYAEPTYVHNRIATSDWKIEKRGRISFHNLIYIYGGRGFFDNGKGKKEVHAGDLVYFAENDSQLMISDSAEPLRLYTVNFFAAVPGFSEGRWRIENAEFNLPFVKTVADEGVRQRFLVLFKRLCHLFPLAESARKSRHREAMTELLALADLCVGEDGISYGTRDKINKAVHFIADNYRQKITLAVLAREAELSPSYFSAVFKEITGKPPIEYLIHFRIFKAKQLLDDGMTVTNAADAVGFADVYYFSNTFKQLEGVTPSDFKKGCRKGRGRL